MSSLIFYHVMKKIINFQELLFESFW